MLNFLRSRGSRGLIVGIAITIIHAVITPMFKTPYTATLDELVWYALTAPGSMFLLPLYVVQSISISEYLPIIISSVFYGLTAGLLASKGKLAILGILFALLLLFLICFFISIVGAVTA